MNINTYILLVILIAASIGYLYGLFKTKKRFLTFWGSAIYGFIAFVLIAISANFTGIHIGINVPSLLCSFFLGIPGVTLLLLINLT